MKLFYACLLLLTTHVVEAQNFYVLHPEPKVANVVKRWLKENNYKVSGDTASASHTILCEQLETGRASKPLVYFNVIERKQNKVLGQTKTAIKKGTLGTSYYLLAQESLKKVLDKIGKTDELSVSLKDSTITIVRPQKIPIIIRTDVLVANLERKASPTKVADKEPSNKNKSNNDSTGNVESITQGSESKNEIIYYLAFDVFTKDLEFKNYISSENVSVKVDGAFPVELLLKADTTVKDKREYKVHLYYKLGASGKFALAKPFTIVVLPEPKKAENAFHKNELVLFAGTTYDHFNPGNKISGLSIEPMASFKFAKRLWAKFGVYVHPNFSRDTTSSRRGGYYKLNDAPLTDTSLIGYSNDVLAVGRKVQSIGFYGDIFFTPREPSKFYEKGTRVSPLGHFEFIKRTVTPTTSVNSIFSDTIIYNKDFFTKNNIPISSQKPDTRNFRSPKYVANQFVFTVGSLIEADVSSFYIYCQPMIGILWQYLDYYETMPIESGISKNFTYAMKLGVRYKNIISLSIDSRDLLSKFNSYLNISFGVPITIADLTKK